MYLDKKRSHTISLNPRVKFPSIVNSFDFSYNLARYRRIVKGKKKTLNKSSYENSEGNIVNSLRDNTGRKLTSEQAEYFKESKVRDEEGNLLTMYHGTPYGGFTVFKSDLSFFTPKKEYADRYHTPTASSRGRRVE